MFIVSSLALCAFQFTLNFSITVPSKLFCWHKILNLVFNKRELGLKQTPLRQHACLGIGEILIFSKYHVSAVLYFVLLIMYYYII